MLSTTALTLIAGLKYEDGIGLPENVILPPIELSYFAQFPVIFFYYHLAILVIICILIKVSVI